MKNLTVRFLENDGRQWFEIDGVEPRTGWHFENEEFAVHADKSILDGDGKPLTPGDRIEIAVKNALTNY